MTPLFYWLKNMKESLVSVIIPTFNRSSMIKEALESVLVQDYRGFEIILVDDGSTDDTLEVLDAYKKDIRLLTQPNKGVSAARNAGVACSNGDFLAFLDSDDTWLPEKLSEQVKFFNSNKDALICQTQEKWIRNGVRVNQKNRHTKLSGMIFKASVSMCLVSPSAVMLKRSLFERMGGFDERLPACEDYDLWLRIGCRHPVSLLNRELIIKRGGHDDQLSRAPGLDKYRIQSLVKIIKENILSSDQEFVVKKVLKKKCEIYGNGCLKRGRREEADYYLSLAVDVG